MSPDEKIYGHPAQVQPAHLVVTSPHYDTREIMLSAKTDVHRHENNYRNAPVDEIIKLKNQGMSYNAIARELELPYPSVREWYLKATGQFKGRKKRIIAGGE